MSISLICVTAESPHDLVGIIAAIQNGSGPTTSPIDFPCRLSILYSDQADLFGKLLKVRAWLQAPDPQKPLREADVYYKSSRSVAKIALLYPGQGSQTVNMLSGLRGVLPGFDDHLNRLDRTWISLGGESLLPRIYQEPSSTAETALQETALQDTAAAQPAIGLVSAALRQSLDSLGIQADFHAGHSYGELSALCGAGVVDERMLLQLSRERGRLLHGAGEEAPGAMLAVFESRSRVLELCRQVDTSLEIANENSPRQFVVSGSVATIETLQRTASAKGIPVKRLKTSCAFHSSLMASAAEEWRRYLEQNLRIQSLAKLSSVFSNVTSQPYAASREVLVDLLARQIVRPVRWVELAAELRASGANVFIEVGPGRALSDLLDSSWKSDLSFLTLRTDPMEKDGRRSLLEMMARLHVEGVGVRWEVFAGAPLETGVDTPRISSQPALGSDARLAYLKENSLMVQKYFAQQHRLVDVAFAGITGEKRTALIQAALDANQKVMSSLLAANETAMGLPRVREAIPEAVPEVMMPIKSPAAPPNIQQTSSSGLPDLLRAEIARVTGFPVGSITNDVSFNDLGIDSLSMTEIWGRMLDFAPSLTTYADQVLEIRSISDLEKLTAAQAPLQDAPKIAPLAPPQADFSAPTVSRSVWSQLRSELLQTLAACKQVSPARISSSTRWEGELGLDAFEKEEIFAKVFEPHPRFRLAGRELLHCNSFADLDRILCRFDNNSSDTVGAQLETRRYVVSREIIRTAPAQTKLPPQVLLVSQRTEAANHVEQCLMTSGTAVFHLYFDESGWHAEGEWAPLGALDDLMCGWKLIAAQRNIPLIFVGESAGSAAVELASCALFLLAKAFWGAKSAKHWAEEIVVIGSGAESPVGRGVLGVCRSLRREVPSISICSVWFASPLTALSSNTLLGTLLAGRPEVSVEADGQWTAPSLTLSPLGRIPSGGSTGTPNLNSESRILLIGGGSGITAELGVGLASKFGCTILAVGRTEWAVEFPFPEIPTGPEEESKLKRSISATFATNQVDVLQSAWKTIARQRELWRTKNRVEAVGGKFFYRQGDLTQAARFHSILEDLSREGPIHGVIHGAGIAVDNLIGRKTLAEFRQVVRTKALAANLLQQALAAEPLQFVYFLSSMTSITGTAGQTDYAAGNEILNAIAQQWNGAASYPVKSLLWSVWSETGLAGATLKQHMARLGLPGISNQEGVELFLEELQSGQKSEDCILFAPPATLQFASQQTARAEKSAAGKTEAAKPAQDEPESLLVGTAAR